MIGRTCERCGATATTLFGIFDYCAVCSKNLCSACMEKGCCDHQPAQSGMKADHVDEGYGDPD